MHTKLNLPLLPLRDIVVFPSMVIPLFVGRDKSITALNDVMKNEKKIILVTQKNSEVDDPKKNDVFNYGCESNILQLLKLPDGTVKVLVEGIKRVKVLDFKEDEKFITCEFEYQNDQLTEEKDLFPLALTAIRRLEKLSSINKKVSTETINNIKLMKDPSKIADNIASHLNTTIIEKQQLFETLAVKKRLNAVIKIMENEASIIGVEKRIRGRVKTQMEKTQREYYLNEQLKAIQKELGEIEDGKDETSNLNKAILKAKMPKEVQKKCMAELKKLKNMSPMSAEATVVRNYLDWMLDVPWYKKSDVNIDLNKATKVLDEDHFGLEKVKERIVEFLAVQKRMQKLKGPILCLVGPPGVGKTSLGKSIARATNRQFIRMSLGGVRDEAEIRGHRRTYIGALPGQIVQLMKRAGSKNPVMLLDEVDKMSTDFRGDPSSALIRQRSDGFGMVLYPTIAETLRCGKSGIGVDAVLVLADSGSKPRSTQSDREMCDRYRYFQQIVKIFREEQTALPLYFSHFLSDYFKESEIILSTSQKIGSPLMTGPSLSTTLTLKLALETLP